MLDYSFWLVIRNIAIIEEFCRCLFCRVVVRRIHRGKRLICRLVHNLEKHYLDCHHIVCMLQFVIVAINCMSVCNRNNREFFRARVSNDILNNWSNIPPNIWQNIQSYSFHNHVQLFEFPHWRESVNDVHIHHQHLSYLVKFTSKQSRFQCP